MYIRRYVVNIGVYWIDIGSVCIFGCILLWREFIVDNKCVCFLGFCFLVKND